MGLGTWTINAGYVTLGKLLQLSPSVSTSGQEDFFKKEFPIIS